jgi:glycosyltransferase involved in cell wall biosynthesis
VLASDIPTLRELIRVSGGGETVGRDSASIAAAIRRLVSDPRRLRALGEQGRTFWETECTVEAVTEWHERLYGSLLRPAGEEAVPVTSNA